MKLPPLSQLCLGFVIVFLSACSSGLQTGSMRGGGNANEITRAQIIEGQFDTAYDVISRLRPRWVRSQRAPTSLRDADQDADGIGRVSLSEAAPRTVIYLDNIRIGEIDALRDFKAEAIDRMEFISATESTTRFGTGNEEGTILLFSSVD